MFYFFAVKFNHIQVLPLVFLTNESVHGNGNSRKTYDCHYQIQMGRGTDRVAGWLISEEHTRFCLGSNLSSGIVKSRHSPQSDLSYIYHFLLSFSLPVLGIAGRLEVYWIFWLPFPSNRMQSDNSSKISPLLNVLPSGYIQIIQTLLEIRNESAISAGQYALCLF